VFRLHAMVISSRYIAVRANAHGDSMLIRMLATLTLLSGCANECQQVCNEMADWADSECSKEFSKDQINECYTKYSGDQVSDAQLADCAEYKDRIDEEWTCDDIADYFE